MPDSNREELQEAIDELCTDIGASAGLVDIDITTLAGGNVVPSSIDKHAENALKRYSLYDKTIEPLNKEQVFLYTNPCMLDMGDLIAHTIERVRHRMDGDSAEWSQNTVSAFIHEHKVKFMKHHHRIIEKANAMNAMHLEQKKGQLARLLMPHTLSKRFLLEVHRNIQCLLATCIAEASLCRHCRETSLVEPLFKRTREHFYKLGYLIGNRVEVPTCVNKIRGEALNAFFPRYYAVLDAEYPMAFAMQPLLDCYARTDIKATDEWHEEMRRAYTMQDYSGLYEVSDILGRMVMNGDNMVPDCTDLCCKRNDVKTLRFIMCVLFVIHVHNTSEFFRTRPMSFTRLDNNANIIEHSATSTYVYDFAPGKFFCRGGYLYVRHLDAKNTGTILRSKCVLSLCLELFTSLHNHA